MEISKKTDGLNYFLSGFRKYAQFSGRSNRSEFWYFFIINFVIISILFLLIDIFILTFTYILLLIIPSIAIGVRRLHDNGKSGKNILFIIIPALLPLLVLFFSINSLNNLPSDAGMGALPIFVILYYINILSLVISGVLFLIFSLLFFIRKSEEGSNKYGPNPSDNK